MSLRLRLIVVFFLLSVVPVGAVTYYTYANNAHAIRDAAGFEAGLLATELTQRMRTVTAQLSQRVETLMALQGVSTTTPTPTAEPDAIQVAQLDPSEIAAAAAAQAQAEVETAQSRLAELGAVERALGSEFASMLRNITIFEGRRGGGRRGGVAGSARGTFLRPDGQTGGRGVPPAEGAPPAGETAGQPPAGPAAEGVGPERAIGPRTDPNAGPPGQGRGGSGQSGRGGRGTPPIEADPSRIRIDLGQLRRQMFDELVPDRDAFDALTPEQRAEIFQRIDQRMQGVQQGIDLLRKELESRAVAITEVRTGADAGLPTAEGAAPLATPPATAPATTTTTALPPAAAPQPVVPSVPTPPAAAPQAPTAPTQRSLELSGSRLAVRVERDGELVGEVGADVDLNLLLASVFETTSRDRGEVPFAVGQDGEVYTSTDDDGAQLAQLQTDAFRPETEPGTTILPNWIIATVTDPTGSGFKFGVARPVGDALRELQQTSARNAILGLAFIGLALVAIVPLSGRLTRNLELLGAGVRRIAQGDYAARVQVQSNDEVGQLARAFNVMAADVERHQRSAVQQERIRRELELGRQIQHDMLPRTPLRLGLTEVKGVSVPAREVGGDFFNYFQLTDGSIALLVGDVSGKGVGAALLMANIQAALRTRLSLGQDLASLAQELDVEIDRTTPGPVYATLFVGILDPVRRQLRCVNAGHNPQYVLRSTGLLDRMESTGRPIGLFSGGGYAEQRFDLAPGDVLFFYTDGCVEAENAAGDMFGTERLEDLLARSAGRGADEVIVAVENEVSSFRAGVELQDDATMMVVKVG